MRQTVKYARVRASFDPDRTAEKGGTYYGNNFPGVFRLSAKAEFGTFFRQVTSHSVHVAACTPNQEVVRLRKADALNKREELREGSELKRLRETFCGTMEAYRRVMVNA